MMEHPDLWTEPPAARRHRLRHERRRDVLVGLAVLVGLGALAAAGWALLG